MFAWKCIVYGIITLRCWSDGSAWCFPPGMWMTPPLAYVKGMDLCRSNLRFNGPGARWTRCVEGPVPEGTPAAKTCPIFHLLARLILETIRATRTYDSEIAPTSGTAGALLNPRSSAIRTKWQQPLLLDNIYAKHAFVYAARWLKNRRTVPQVFLSARGDTFPHISSGEVPLTSTSPSSCYEIRIPTVQTVP